MKVIVKEISTPKEIYKSCQNCAHVMEMGVEFYDGESLFPPDQSGWKAEEQYWGHILLSMCPECDAWLYALEVSVLSHPIKGKKFFNDDFYSEQLVETKLVKAGLWEWPIDRHINVKFDDNAGHDYAGQSMPSIDVHTIGLFVEGETIRETGASAAKLFQLFLPYIKHIQDLKQAMS